MPLLRSVAEGTAWRGAPAGVRTWSYPEYGFVHISTCAHCTRRRSKRRLRHSVTLPTPGPRKCQQCGSTLVQAAAWHRGPVKRLKLTSNSDLACSDPNL